MSFEEIVRLIDDGAGRYDLLSVVVGEPTVHPRLFDILEHARRRGYAHLGISSNFRRFAYPAFTARVLEAGVRFFDLSLHAHDRATQAILNPIGDAGASLDQTLAGLRNVLDVARAMRVRVEITHKIVACAANLPHLADVFALTHRMGVQDYIVQELEPTPACRELSLAGRDWEGALRALATAVHAAGATLRLHGFERAPRDVLAITAGEENRVTNRYPGGRRRVIDPRDG